MVEKYIPNYCFDFGYKRKIIPENHGGIVTASRMKKRAENYL